ncbi:nitroreductase [Actinomycetota bacterium]|nr:nitroreductase [Actinomycetota bacterium]
MSNTILETIASRYTARDYTGEVVPDADLQAIANAGLQAPSAYNSQPWAICVVTNLELINDLQTEGLSIMENNPATKTGYDRIMQRGGKLFYNAPAIIFVSIQSGTDALSSAPRDAGIVVENMALAATALGYGNCICGLAGIPLSGPRADEFAEILKFPDGYEFGIALLVGKTTTEPTPHEVNREKLTFIK